MENTKREFYENGNVKGEHQVNESGELHGTMKLYHENGQLQVEVSFTNGIQDDGEIISYHDNGFKARQVIRLKGSFNGAFTEWHKNGQPKISGTYKNNKSNIHKEWDQEGNLLDFKNIKFNNETIRKVIKDWCEDQQSTLNKYGDINTWDTSEVTDMSKLFLDAHEFNSPIGNWDVSNVTNMSGMFASAESFNLPIGDWDVSNVKDMSEMFFGAESFNQPIGNWDVSNVTDMTAMFTGAKLFNQSIGDWDVSNVEDMSEMFYNAESFNQPIGDWDVSNVEGMSYMFYFAESFNQPIGDWDVSNVENMSSMFEGAESFNQPIGDWDVTKVESMTGMFSGAESFNQDVSKLEIEKKQPMEKYLDLPFEELMSVLEAEYFGENESVSQSTLSTETKNRSNSIQQETLSMYIPIYNVMISEKSIVTEVLKKLRESESNSVLNSYCKKHLMGSFAIPNDLKDEIDILEIKIDILQCDTYDDSNIFFDLEFDIVFNIKTEKNQAIKAIQSFEKNNHDLRWRAIPLWNQSNNNFIDSWDKTMIGERIEENPQWYLE